MDEETLIIIEFIKFNTFKEKLNITKKYDRKAKMEIVDDKYVLVERREEVE